MDPELYVFPNIKHPAIKIAASSLLFAVVIAAAWRLLPQPAPGARIDAILAQWLPLVFGYGLFIYASVQAWRAAREKNSVEDPKTQAPTRLLETGFFGRVRHPMYGMFILANAGLGLAVNSVYGLGFSLLSLLVFVANGIFEERVFLVPHFGDAYRAYMRRVPARYFTLRDGALLTLALALTLANLFLR